MIFGHLWSLLVQLQRNVSPDSPLQDVQIWSSTLQSTLQVLSAQYTCLRVNRNEIQFINCMFVFFFALIDPISTYGLLGV